MTIDSLADLLKERGCTEVCYFHTDHFEPWSSNIDDASARAVERMARMARNSPYARRLSLFYSVFIPYRSSSDGPAGQDDSQVSGDGVVFSARSRRQEDVAREVIRPLVMSDGHEMHLHVHHEYWTRNASNLDHPVSRWVNSSSTRLVGMFAIILWDSRFERLVVARDRFGEKPLYYMERPEGMLFGSEIKAILSWPGVPRRPNPAALHDFLSFSYTIGTDMPVTFAMAPCDGGRRQKGRVAWPASIAAARRRPIRRDPRAMGTAI